MNDNNVETPTEMTVGEILRNARTTGRRKREISTVAKQLCIREEFLQALEDGNYKEIPEVVYILGFARNYAMELGLDPDEIVTKLKKEMGLISDCEDETVNEKGGACTIPGKDKLHNFHFKSFLKDIYNFVRKNWLWVLGGFVVILAVVLSLILFVPKENTENANNISIEPVVTVQEPEYKVAVRERFGTENAETAEIILQANQESWVKVEDGRGNTVFSRVLVPGDVYYVPSGDDKYKATFGNAGGVDIWVNGKLAPKQGANHVRKAGISLTVDGLMPTAAAE